MRPFFSDGASGCDKLLADVCGVKFVKDLCTPKISSVHTHETCENSLVQCAGVFLLSAMYSISLQLRMGGRAVDVIAKHFLVQALQWLVLTTVKLTFVTAAIGMFACFTCRLSST